ncbi:GlsB/YeaQ/YmgE family stress response membrane protein [Streptococcus caballi]|uniref:GlsB/YeaQ/YmgE family stress response membrane protein n=1 Tax=Streptococcus caballi TaxID=439220 RepID=UPI0003674A8D|nr:GlsB/YeaQ/YmgE family stress response membrane protein [Streptococcus caballi]
MIWSLIIGALIGAVAGAITNRSESQGCIFNIFAGLVGSAIGQSLFGYWGPSLAGMALLPSVLGAIIVIAVVDLLFGRK